MQFETIREELRGRRNRFHGWRLEWRSRVKGRATSGFLAIVVGLGVLGGAASSSRGFEDADPPGELVDDSWHKLTIQGARVGYGRGRVYRSTHPDGDRFISVTEGKLDLGRLGQSTTIESKSTTVETEAGKLLSIVGELVMAKSPTRYKCTLEGDEMVIVSEAMGQSHESRIDWNPAVVTERVAEKIAGEMAREEPGTTRKVLVFEPTSGQILSTTMQTESQETIESEGRQVLTTRILSFADLVPNAVSRSWIDSQGRILRTSSPLLGGIDVVSDRCSKEEALEESSGEKVPDVMASAMLKSNVFVPRSRLVDEVLYRVRLKEGAKQLPDFPESHFQKIESLSEREAVIRVKKALPGHGVSRPVAGFPDAIEEALRPSLLIQSDDPAIVALAKKTAEGQTDAWKTAVSLERFVFDYIDEKGYETAFASASEVVKDKTGDCSEHAVLLAALCKSVGIPARVAMGLEYIAGTFAPHAWTEVWVGDWFALDGTNGLGFVDAAHLTFGTDAFDDDGDSNMFLKLAQAFGYLEVEVLELRYGDRVLDCRKKPVVMHRISGDRFENAFLGVAFEKPSSWAFDRAFGVANIHEICELKPAKRGVKIELEATSVGYAFRLEDILAVVKAQDGTAEEMKVDGRRALRVRRTRSGGEVEEKVLVHEGETLFVFELRRSSDDEVTIREYEALLESVDFDLRPEPVR